MRLDEWQRYIDSQFLDDEPAPSSSSAAEGVPQAILPSVPAAPPVPESNSDTEIVSPESAGHAPSELQITDDPQPVHISALESIPNSVQNVLTVVVTPTPTPALPSSPRSPIIELLTPLPDSTGNYTGYSGLVSSRSDSSPDTRTNVSNPVVNRTRRRPKIGTQHVMNVTDKSESKNSEEMHDNVSDQTTPELLTDLQSQLLGSDDIPDFVSYMPTSYGPTGAPDYILTDHEPARITSLHGNGSLSPANYADDRIPSDVSTVSSDMRGHRNIYPHVRPEDTESDETEGENDQDSSKRRPPRTRARHARNVRPDNVPSGLSASELWAQVPRHVQTLLSLERMEEEEVAQSSYKRPFQEKRHELIERLLDPILSLEDTARLLNVCPTTVRRYTNKGILTYYRKEPDKSTKTSADPSPVREKETRQRRFRLSDILAFLETQQAAIQADRRAELQAERRRQERATQIATSSVPDPPPGETHKN